MACRCTDIRNCIQDIHTLQNLISPSGEMGAMQLYAKNELENELKAIGNSCPSVFEADTMSELKQAFLKANDEIENFINEVQSDIQAEVVKLTNQLPIMRAEDDSYHDDD